MKKFKSYLIYSLLLCSQIVNVANAQTIKSYITNEWPDSRYTDNANGTVTDANTGLIWKKCLEGFGGSQGLDCSTGAETTYTWKGALDLAKVDSTAGSTDWRLPNIKELGSLVAYDRFSPAINSSLFPNTRNSSHWSSSPYAANSNVSWRLEFDYGADFSGDRNTLSFVRLVRGGQ